MGHFSESPCSSILTVKSNSSGSFLPRYPLHKILITATSSLRRLLLFAPAAYLVSLGARTSANSIVEGGQDNVNVNDNVDKTHAIKRSKSIKITTKACKEMFILKVDS